MFPDSSESSNAPQAAGERERVSLQRTVFGAHPDSASAPVAIAAFDSEMRYLAASPQWLAFFDLGDDILGRSHYALFPNLPEKWKQAHRRALSGEIVRGKADRFTRPNGESHWMQWEAFPWQTAEGAIGGIAISALDVTARIEAEVALREQQERYAALIQASSQVVWAASADGAIEEVSPSWEAFTGQTLEQTRGNGWLAVVHPDDAGRVVERWRAAIAAKDSLDIEYRVRHRGGEWRWMFVRCIPLLARDGSVREWVGMNTDIDARKRAESHAGFISDLHASLMRARDPNLLISQTLEQLARHLGADGGNFGEFSRDGRFFTIHQEYGGRGQSLLGGRSSSQFGSDERIEAILSGKGLCVENVARDPSGAPHAENYRLAGVAAFASEPLMTPEGVRGLLTVTSSTPRAWRPDELQLIRNAAALLFPAIERARAEVALIAREKELRAAKETAERASRAKDEFLSVMSHELRTPLNPIIGFAQLLQQKDKDPFVQEASSYTLHAARRMLEMVESILFFTQLNESEQMLGTQKFALADVIEEPQAMSKTQTGAPALRIVNGGESLRPLDPDRKLIGPQNAIGQVIVNFLNNAFKYGEGSPVQILLGLKGEPASGELRLRVEVSDHGPGVPEEYQEELFKPFTQADSTITRMHEGIGLGLAICQKLVARMGGEIGYRPNHPRGAVFWFDAPVVPADDPQEAPTADRGPESRGEPLSRTAVLVVEDNADNSEYIAAALKQLGAHPRQVASGEEAITLCRSERFDVALIDLSMHGMSGFETLQRLRRIPGFSRRTRCAAVTAHASQKMRIVCEREGFDAFLPKPVSPAELSRAIARLSTRPS